MKESYAAGEVVTLTATPDEGCYLEFIEGKAAGRTEPWRTAQTSTTVTLGDETAGEWFAWFNTGEIIWQEDFESVDAEFDWSATRGVWEIAEVSATHGPKYAFEGSRCAATDADADYPDNISSGFQKFFAIELPEVDDNRRLLLSYWHWFALNRSDYSVLRYRVLGTESWIEDRRFDWNGRWTKNDVDLTAYAGREIEIELRLVTADDRYESGWDVASGWFVDMFTVKNIPHEARWNSEGFENGRGQWTVNNGQWEIGIPLASIGAHSGRMVAGTCLLYNYFDNEPSTLTAPARLLPAADQRPRFVVEQWYSLSRSDSGRIGLKVRNDPTTYYIGETLSGSAPSWTRSIWEISEFAGQEVQLLFEFSSIDDRYQSGWDTSHGWFIDDISCIPAAPPAPTYAAYYPSATYATHFDRIELTWKDAYVYDFTSRYDVYRGTSSNWASTGKLVAAGLRGQVYHDTTAKIGQQYFYWVQAQRDGQPAPLTTWASGLRDVGAPQSITVSQGDFPNHVLVSWSRVAGVTQYDLERDGTIIMSGISATRFEDTATETGRNYTYRVRAIAGDRVSLWSDPGVGYRVADAVNSLVATDGLFLDKIRVSWSSIIGADSYDLYRNTTNNRDAATLLEEGLAANVFEDTTADASRIYFYWVKANRAGLLTDFSNGDPGYRRLEGQTDLYAWGDNTFGETAVPASELGDIIAIDPGVDHGLALKADGTVVGWGRDIHGQASPPPDLQDVVDIAVGYDHSMALKKNGEVVAWGRNIFGKTAIPVLGTVIGIAAGSDHSLALLANGTVVAWGGNDYGQTNVPEGLNQVVEIAAGGFHSIARKADGSIVVWGDNEFGQLNVPGQVKNALKIAAGWNHCLIIKEDGTVEAWGADEKGQTNVPAALGQNPIIAPQSGDAVRNVGPGAVASISAGLFHSIAVTRGGDLIAWGDNSASQSTKPFGLTTTTMAAAGEAHNVAVTRAIPVTVHHVSPPFALPKIGSDLILRVHASGPPSLSFQWKKDGVPIAGQTQDTLALTGIAAVDAGSYSVVVTDGTASDESEWIPVEPVSDGIELQPARWLEDTRLGWVYGWNANWAYSLLLGNSYVAAFPWLYHESWGWMLYGRGGAAYGMWINVPSHGWVYTHESYGGWFTWPPYTDADWDRFF